MRIISLITASVFVAASPAAWAEGAPAEPPKAETQAAPATPTPEKFTESIRPATQSNAPKPRESGLDQPLCTGE
ncbi:hypothetical protein [Candidatus Ferrigenium straubiae]|uniref:hypothetical protein n=1 Tax=Candidatus Ferrigenium straubiae TaxID=2919506 RepID=UPI003F4AF6D5